ncbi:MAG: hypothetical protein A2W80_18295 [Candidatus Riflebacteria bacterium GWC2_50_8]|nr:MAG: hypothetical protein A2W80_18295 [Candidatus Riflebacteria bacterium GWC2_50_8]
MPVQTKKNSIFVAQVCRNADMTGSKKCLSLGKSTGDTMVLECLPAIFRMANSAGASFYECLGLCLNGITRR